MSSDSERDTLDVTVCALTLYYNDRFSCKNNKCNVFKITFRAVLLIIPVIML